MSMTRLTLDCYRPMLENLIYYNENGFHMNLSFEEKDIDHIDMGETYNASCNLNNLLYIKVITIHRRFKLKSQQNDSS